MQPESRPYWKPRAREKAEAKEMEVKLSLLFTSPAQRAFSPDIFFVLIRWEHRCAVKWQC